MSHNKKRRPMNIYLEDIADAVDLSVDGVKKAKQRGQFNPSDLKSIAYFIVQRTLTVPTNKIRPTTQNE